MDDANLNLLLEKQRQFFKTGETLSLAFRIRQLKTLKTIIETHEDALIDALKKDLGKSKIEALTTEILLTIDEIKTAIKKLKSWVKPCKVKTPYPLWPGHSTIYREPYGSVLIIGPWNYPFLLIFSPLIGAISAGNCAIVKPSEVSAHTAKTIARLINQYFPKEFLFAIEADASESERILQEKFDYIFFTGGIQIGKAIMVKAAQHLTPITLELGGKSPCIVDETANLDFAARRIIWAKTTNAGQTCIAPDYLYVEQSIKEKLVQKLKETVQQFYGEDPQKSLSYARIINQKHFDRLVRLMQNGRILFGGKTDEEDRYLSPTLIDEITWHDPIMQEEIFGPLLPILSYQSLDDVIHMVNAQPKSLALYLFTQNKQTEKKVVNHISFGSGCINDCVLQFFNLALPFGGVGSSGMGHYHGQHSFETFSHQKSIYKKTVAIDLKLEYPPYHPKKFWLLRKLLQW